MPRPDPQLGRPRALELLKETTQRTGVTADSHAEASIDAMRHMGMRRIAIASRWSDDLNQKLVAYLEAADFEVLTVTSVGQWAEQAFSMSIEEGVKLAFQAYRAMRAGAAEQTVAGGFTEDQQFFLANGQAWCGKMREEVLRLIVQTNPHSPPKYRVNGPLANLPEFGEAFKCAPGTPMRPANACSVW